MQSDLRLGQASEFVGLLYVHQLVLNTCCFLMLDVCGATTSAWLTCLSFRKSDFQSSVHMFGF